MTLKSTTGLLGCDVNAGDDVKCVSDWLPRFGRRAFRRPLAATELEALRALYASSRTRVDRASAVETVVRAVLTAPSFVDLVEGTSAAKDAPPVAPLTAFELAARLSFFLWSAGPDEPLLAAAEANALSTPAQVDAQARRLLADRARVARTIGRFHREWLKLLSYPGVNNEVNETLAVDETARFASFVVLEGDGLLKTLLTAPFTFASIGHAKLYGIPSTGLTFGPTTRVDLPAHRAGILMLSGFLGAHSSPSSSPVRRGVVLLERVLCQEAPAPPMDIPPAPPASLRTTTRQRLEQHRANPACGGCHALIDPPGLVFEGFDTIGRYRETEAGQPVDTRAELRGTRDLDGSYAGALPFVAKLAASRQVSDCVAHQWFRFALGRHDDAADAADLRALSAAFAASGGNLRELLVATTQTQAFRTRRTVSFDPARGARP